MRSLVTFPSLSTRMSEQHLETDDLLLPNPYLLNNLGRLPNPFDDI